MYLMTISVETTIDALEHSEGIFSVGTILKSNQRKWITKVESFWF